MKHSIYLLVLVGMLSCTSTKILDSTSYKSEKKVEKLFVLVIGDKNTEKCYDYLTKFLSDSLRNYAEVTSKYNCCGGDFQSIMRSSIPKNEAYDHYLIVTSTKVVIGHGTSSSRELNLSLFEPKNSKPVWESNVNCMFSWFISDANYRSVANHFNLKIIEEMRTKGIIQ